MNSLLNLTLNSRPIILVVEDYEDARQCLVELLGRRGFDTDQAGDVREAVAMFNARCADSLPCYDAMISDIHLPSASGLGLLRAVRAVRSRLPVFMVTAYDDEAIKGLVQEQGAEYDTKPVDPAAFVEKVAISASAYHANKPIETHPPLKLEDVILEMMGRVENS